MSSITLTEEPKPFQLFPFKATAEGFLDRSGYKLHYNLHGEGPIKVICIMGLLSSMGGWSPIINHFVPTGQFQFLVFDNRGVGESTTGSFGRYTTGGMAKDVAALLDHVGWTGERVCHLVGISMGGMIALEAAHLLRERFRSLTLLCTCAERKSPPKYPYQSEKAVLKRHPDINSRANGLIDIGFSDEEWMATFDPKFPQFKTNRDRVFFTFKERMENTNRPGIKTLVGQGLAVRTHRVSKDKLAEIGKAIPDIVAVTGLEDKMIDPDCTSYMAANLPCRPVFLKGKGHILLFESEEETIKELAQNFGAGEKRWTK